MVIPTMDIFVVSLDLLSFKRRNGLFLNKNHI